MKRIRVLLAGVAFAAFSAASPAQFVQGNDAVKTMPDGSRKIETPPLPRSGTLRHSRPCVAAEGCYAGPWLMVETREGLLECTEAYARARSCRASTYGSQKLARLWVVHSGDRWLQCQMPSLSSRCVSMFAKPPENLPYPAVQ